MEFINNTGSAAIQPYYSNHREDPPSYESTSNLHSGDILSEDQANTQLPPPYSTLDTESYVGDWVPHASNVFWSRTVKRRGQTWCQYSILSNDAIPWAGNGLAFFTCGMIPREGYNEENIRRICEATVIDLSIHRCDCPVCAVQHVQPVGHKCFPSISGSQLRTSMARHDLACSCKCFDVHSPPRQALSMPIAPRGTPQEIGIAHDRPPEPAWESEAREGQFYWFRTIRKHGRTQFQCGINTHDGTRYHGEVPDHFFTCGIMPRAGYTRSMITEACKNVALALKLHRKNHRGDCSVCDFRHVQGKRVGCPASVHSMVRAQWLGTMKSHDEACSCRCFHIDRHGRPMINDASGTPQYHAGTDTQVVNRGLEIPEDGRVYQPWESASIKFSSIDTYWTRMVKNGDEIWQQYGISERQSDGQPEFFFTCKMSPRKGKNEQIIRELCVGIASIMRGHRSTNYNRCACNFQTWRKPGGPGGCRVSWYHLNKRITRNMIDFLMRSHDEVCSCGCFDIGSGENTDPSGQWLRD